MTEAAIVYIVLGVLIALFIWDRLPVEIVSMAAPLALLATGVITLDQTFLGFGDTIVIFIASLFIVAEGIDATGVTSWAGQWMATKAGASESRLIVVMMGMVALLTALISVNGAVAAFIPMVVVVAVRSAIPPSRLLMPLAFGAHAGSQLVLTGSPIHIMVSDAAVDAGASAFRFFDFALVGVPLVLATIAVARIVGGRLLPDREPESITADLSDHARTLINQYALGEWVANLKVPEESSLVGTAADQVDEVTYPDLEIVDVTGKIGRIEQTKPVPDGAVITVRGPTRQIDDFVQEYDLTRLPTVLGGIEPLMDRRVGVVELVIPPRSPIIGEYVFPGETTSSGDFVILAVQRNGVDVGLEGAQLAVGDLVLLQGTWDALDRFDPDDALFVNDPSAIRRQAVPMGPGSKRAIVILLAMVVLLASGVVPAVIAGVLAAGAMILTRVVSVREAYRSVNWTIIVLVATMIPVSAAVQQSGAARQIADVIIDIVGDAGPYALLLALFIITAVFGQLISNTATALIMIPIAITAAQDLGISVLPVMMSLTVASAAAFLTPIATAANLMVMAPAGYKFSDYWKFGSVMLLLFMVASVLVVPIFWPF